MRRTFVLWPPPWKLSSGWRRTVVLPWFVAMVPIFVVATSAAAAVALVSKVTGWGATVKRSREEVAGTIDDFVNGRAGQWDWDDFVSVPIADPYLESIRARCAHLDEEFPASAPGSYCGERGYQVLKRFVRELRESDG